jgi:hypothetical protein
MGKGKPPRGKGGEPLSRRWSTRAMGVRWKKNAFSPKSLDTTGPSLGTRLSTLPPRRGKGRGWGLRSANASREQATFRDVCRTEPRVGQACGSTVVPCWCRAGQRDALRSKHRRFVSRRRRDGSSLHAPRGSAAVAVGTQETATHPSAPDAEGHRRPTRLRTRAPCATRPPWCEHPHRTHDRQQ